MITIEDDDEVNDENPEGVFATPPSSPGPQNEPAEELQVSMHAVSGTSAATSTFNLMVRIGRVNVVALADSGSIATFITPSIALKAHC